METGHPLRAALGYQNGSLPSGMDQTIPAKCGLDYQLGNFFQDIVHVSFPPPPPFSMTNFGTFTLPSCLCILSARPLMMYDYLLTLCKVRK